MTSGRPDAGGEGAVPAEYVIGHVGQALGDDPRVGEWHLDVDVDGPTVTISGVVATSARKAAVAVVAAESLAVLGDGYRVVDATHVMAADAPRGEEELS